MKLCHWNYVKVIFEFELQGILQELESWYYVMFSEIQWKKLCYCGTKKFW